MKRNGYASALFLLLMFFVMSLNAQVLVNKAWQDTTGNPQDTLAIQFAAKDGSSNYIELGNTWPTSDSEQILITKYSNAGSQLWQVRIPSPSTKRFIATNMDISGSYIYFCASPFDSVNNKSTFVTYKISDSTGATVWAKQYIPSYTGYAVPAVLREDTASNVYVAGTEQISSTGYEMTFLKYNSSGTLQFSTHYDSVGLYSGAVGMGQIAKDSAFPVSGYSGSAFGTWDIVSMEVNAYTGATKNINRVSNGSGSFISHPVALAKDNSGDTYIVGASEVSGPNIDIKLIKYDSLFNQVFVKTWGGPDSLDDEPAYMVNDGLHNLIITGYTTHANGEVDLLVVKYDKNGNLLWSRTFNNPNSSGTIVAKGASVVVDDSNYIYVTGKIYNGTTYDIFSIATDTGGSVRWLKTYDGGAGNNAVGMNISLDNANNVWVSGTTGASTLKYITIKYAPWNRNMQFDFDTSGLPKDVQNEVIVRFDESVFNSAFVQNLNLVYGSPSQVFTSAFNTTLSTKLFKTEGSSTMVRIFRDLNPLQTTCKTRLGETNTIPDFWTGFVLVMPVGSGYTPMQVCDSLKTLFPLVRYCMPNYTAKQESNPNDYDFFEQYSLNPGGAYDSASINILPAWAIEMGAPFARVGVLDGGINWQIPDFGYTTTNPNTTRVVDGYDFQHSGKLKNFTPGVTSQDDIHANGMAGIIGAVTNDSASVMYSCIAGIAGGFYQPNMAYDTGVSLYGLTIFGAGTNGGDGNFLYAPLDYLADAIVESSIDSTGTNYKFGLHVMNNSWGLDYNSGAYYTGYNISILNDAVHFANRQKVIFVAARGNNGNDSIVYPACYDPDWVINVGGTGTDGHYKNTSGEPSLAASWGDSVDIAAPADAQIIHTLGTGQIPCETIGATSAATAHASGVAALMVSYLDSTVANYNNLAPEDVDFIFHKTATRITPGGAYSDSTGYGRLNAGAALQLIEKPYHHLYHFGSDNFTNTKSHSLYSTNDSIFLSEPWPSTDSALYGAVRLSCDVWKVSATVNHTLASSDSIVYDWPRNSSSTPFDLYNSTTHTLVPHEKVHITSISNTNAQLYGYVYHLKNSSGTYIGWLPFDTTLANSTFDYSILTKNTLVNSVQPITTADNHIKVYPNPFDNVQTIVIENAEPEKASITLLDLEGRQLKNCFNGMLNQGTNQFTIDLNELPSGMYFYQILDGQTLTVKKIIKM